MSTTNPSKILTAAEVVKQERTEVERQRNVRFSGQAQQPEENENHMGLCFSGGGIRSATLNLGILQGLQETGVLKQVDYLSTVSGGGYIGSWFCATRHRLAAAAKAKNEVAAELLKGDRFLIEDESPGLGSPMLRHLRQHARYLAPEAGITSGDLWTMISIWTRNTLLMQLTVFMALFFLISFFQAAPLVFQWLVRDGSPYSLLWFGMTIVQILCVATASACGLCELRKVLKGNKQEQIKAGAGMPAVVITGCLAIASVCGGAQIFAGFADGQKSVWADTPCQIFAGLLALSSSIMMGMARRYQFPPEKKWGRVMREALIHLACFPALAAAVMAVIWLLAKVFHAIGSAHLESSFDAPVLTDYYTAGAIAWSSVVTVPLLLGGYGLVMIVATGLLGGHAWEVAMEWLARAGAWMVMALLLSGLVLAVAVAGPVWVDYLFSGEVSNWLRSTIVGGWVAGSIGAVVMGHSESTNGSPAEGGVKKKIT